MSFFYFQLAFAWKINEILETNKRSEKDRRLKLEQKLQTLCPDGAAMEKKLGGYFHLEPSPISACLRCRACLTRSEENTTVCRYHPDPPLRYPAWKHFHSSFNSSGKNEMLYRYWPCCSYLGTAEPDGCLEMETHILQP